MYVTFFTFKIFNIIYIGLKPCFKLIIEMFYKVAIKLMFCDFLISTFQICIMQYSFLLTTKISGKSLIKQQFDKANWI